MIGKMNRREVLIASCAAAAVLGSGRIAVAADKRLRFTWWGGQARADRTLKAVQLYGKANPGITVDTEYLGWGDYWTRLATLASGGNPADVMQMDIEYLAEYASRGALLPLDPYVPTPLAVGDFDPGILNNGKVGDQLYAIACGVNAAALVVDSSAYAEAGVAPPNGDTTWEDFGRIAAEFSKATPRKNMFGSPDESRNQEVLETWVRQRGKELFHEDGSLGYAESDIADWFEMWAEMRASGGVASPEVQALDHFDIDSSLLSQGRAPVAFAYSNYFVAYKSMISDPLVLVPYPKLGPDGKGGLYVKPTLFFSISAKTAEPEVAAGLISYLLTNPDSTAVLGIERGVPASISAREALRPKLDESDREAIDYLANLGSHAGAIPPANPPGGGEISEALIKTSEEVAFGEKSPAEGAKSFYERAQAILTRAS